MTLEERVQIGQILVKLRQQATDARIYEDEKYHENMLKQAAEILSSACEYYTALGTLIFKTKRETK